METLGRRYATTGDSGRATSDGGGTRNSAGKERSRLQRVRNESESESESEKRVAAAPSWVKGRKEGENKTERRGRAIA